MKLFHARTKECSISLWDMWEMSRMCVPLFRRGRMLRTYMKTHTFIQYKFARYFVMHFDPNWTQIYVTEHVNVFDFDAISVPGEASPIWAFSINYAIASLSEQHVVNQIMFRCRCDYNTDRSAGNEAGNNANSAFQMYTFVTFCLSIHRCRKI